MKHAVLGVLVDAVEYDTVVEDVVRAAQEGRPLALTALAAHGVVEAWRDPELRHRVNGLDLVTPDGQAVRWSLNLLHRTGLRDRVYGPELARRVLARAADGGLPVFLYGSTADVLERLRTAVPGAVAGSMPSRFRTVGPDELDAIAATIRSSGARLVLVGLGCPRQEAFVSAMRDRVGVPTLAIGAGFEYLAGLRREPPPWVQRAGLQWAWRLAAEPRRLWRRYVVLNPLYAALVMLQAARVWRPRAEGREPPPDGVVPA